MNRYKNSITNVLKDKERKSLIKIIPEIIGCAIREKEIPIYYFTNLLYKKDVSNIYDYIGMKRIRAIKRIRFRNNIENKRNLVNKVAFNQILENYNVPTAKTIGYNFGDEYFLKGNCQPINSNNDFKVFIQKILSESENESVFIKPLSSGGGGGGTYKLQVNDLDNNSLLQDIYKQTKNVDYIFQESITQHPIVNQLNPFSVNTIRIHSYVDESGKHRIASALIRCGTNENIVDSGSQGGIFAEVDTDSWSIIGNGQSFFINGGKNYEEHPNTNIKFNGLKLPYSDEIEKVVIKAAKLYPEMLIGWDVALSNKGPMIIEGNSSPHLVMAQISCGGFRKNIHFKNYLSKYLSESLN